MKKIGFLFCICFLSTITFAQTWTSFGTGIPNGGFDVPSVNSIIEYNGILYAGGSITTAGGVNINGGLATWDGYGWANGNLSSIVKQMMIFNDTLYAVGSFGIKKLVDTGWTDVGTGLNAAAYTMCVYNNEIYVGGQFTQAGGNEAYYLAKWNGTAWSAVGGGCSAAVNNLVVYSGQLFVIGSFTQVDGSMNVNGSASWNGSSWSTIPGFAPAATTRVAVYRDTLYYISNAGLVQYANDSGTVLLVASHINGSPTCFIVLLDQLYLGFQISCGSVFCPLAYIYAGGSLQSFTTGNYGNNGAGYCFGEYNCQVVASGMFQDDDFARLWNVPQASVSANTITACQGDSVVFADTVCQGITTWLWHFPGGTPDSSVLENPVVYYTQAGTYSASLIVTNPAGSDTITVSNYITVVSAPATPTITPIGNILVSSASSGNQWYRNDTLIAGETTHLDTVPNHISFYQCYSVQVTNGSGCVAVSDTLCFAPQSCTVGSTVDAAICSGSFYSFNHRTLTEAGTYIDTLVSTGGCDSLVTLNLSLLQTLTTTTTKNICPGQSYEGHTATGTYIDTVTAVTGCDSIITLKLTVQSVLQSNVYDTICEGSAYTFNDSLRTTSGTYSETLVSGSGCDSMVVLNLSVAANPGEPVITQHSDSLVSSPAQSYLWLYNGTPITDDTTESIVPTANGNYTVQVTGANGCSNSSGIYSYQWSAIQSVESNLDIRVYPNPADGTVTVEFADNTMREISVTDILGQTVIPSKIISSKMALDMHNLTSGIYFICIENGDSGKGKIYKEITVQH